VVFTVVENEDRTETKNRLEGIIALTCCALLGEPGDEYEN
jgi:hypothetical protein